MLFSDAAVDWSPTRALQFEDQGTAASGTLRSPDRMAPPQPPPPASVIGSTGSLNTPGGNAPRSAVYHSWKFGSLSSRQTKFRSFRRYHVPDDFQLDALESRLHNCSPTQHPRATEFVTPPSLPSTPRPPPPPPTLPDEHSLPRSRIHHDASSPKRSPEFAIRHQPSLSEEKGASNNLMRELDFSAGSHPARPMEQMSVELHHIRHEYRAEYARRLEATGAPPVLTIKSTPSPVSKDADAEEKHSSPSQPTNKCRCRRSACLKMYCDCFAHGKVCGVDCVCIGCKNDVGNQKGIETARLAAWTRNPKYTFGGNFHAPAYLRNIRKEKVPASLQSAISKQKRVSPCDSIAHVDPSSLPPTPQVQEDGLDDLFPSLTPDP